MFVHNDKKNPTVSQILKDTGLDFTIIKERMTCVYDGKVLPSPYFALINDKSGEIINSVKSGYTISQNEDIVKMVVEGMKNFGDLSIKTGGSINGGKKVYLQLAIEGNAKVGNDTIKRYVTIIDSNDGSSSLSVGVGDFTMSCANMFFAFSKLGQSRFRHTATLEQRLLELPSLIESALAESMRMMELYKSFQSTPCSRDLAHSMVNHLLGFDKASMTKKEFTELSGKSLNAMNSLYDNIETEMNGKGENVWGLHSGVTRWTTHVKSAPRRTNGRVESIMMGTNYKVNQKSLEFATELVS
jgi:phage/plasmid-like protein (TIGR03299 family)